MTASPDRAGQDDERIAGMIRDQLYPEFSAAPAPEWALRAARLVRAALAATGDSEPLTDLPCGYCSRDFPHSHSKAILIGPDPHPEPATGDSEGPGRFPDSNLQDDDYDPALHAGHEAFIKHGLCSHPSHTRDSEGSGLDVERIALKAAEIGFTYGALGRDFTYAYKNVQDMLAARLTSGDAPKEKP